MQGDERRDGARERILEKGKEVMKDDEQETRRPSYRPYPKAAAKFEEVVANPKLFKDTLEGLHFMMGTKYMVPIVGGRDLDLHRLFVEVTSRGGVEKLVAEKRFKEVTAVFNFPSTATNASFILRKYYMSLLYHYEQIYFFGAQGWSSPDSSNTLSLNHVPSGRLVAPVMPSYESQIALLNQGRNNAPSNALSLNTVPSNRLVASVTPSYESQLDLLNRGSNGQSSIARSQVVGIIDGQFEHGYFVTVTVGSAKLRGVLYPVPERTAVQVPQYSGIRDDSNHRGIQVPQHSGIHDDSNRRGIQVPQYSGIRDDSNRRGIQVPQYSGIRDDSNSRGIQVPQYSGIRDDRNHRGIQDQQCNMLSMRDIGHPTPNRSGYNFFFDEHHARLRLNSPANEREISKMIGELWNKLTETEKAVYLERGLRDKERYLNEMAIYRQRQRMSQVITNAVPIRQCPMEPASTGAGPSRPIIDLTLTDEDDTSSDDTEDHDVDNDDDDGGDDDASTDKISDGESEGETTLVLGADDTESSSSTEQSSEGRSA